MAKKGQKFMSYDNDFREQIVQDYLNSNLGYKKIRKYKNMGTTDNQKLKNNEIDYKKRYEILKKYLAFLKEEQEKK